MFFVKCYKKYFMDVENEKFPLFELYSIQQSKFC